MLRAKVAGATPLRWSRTFLPHRQPNEPADFHRSLGVELNGLHLRRGTKLAVLAPRGGAKSTAVTLSYALRAALEGWEPYILILSDAGGQADKFLADLREEIEGNALLAAVYPEACGPGGAWRANAVRLKNGVLIESLGRGGKVRGRRNRQHRPTLTILDDCQGNADITSPTERARAWDWFTREVLPARDPRGNVISVGTALHREAVAVRAGTLPGWTARTYRAVHRWPDRMDLWEEWARLASNQIDPDRDAKAAAFLDHHHADMHAGAVTYWPARYPLSALMAERAVIGPAAFATEYQQEPGVGAGAEWPPEYFDGVPCAAMPPDAMLRVAFYDPAGEPTARPGDYHALALLAIDGAGTLWFDLDLWRGPAGEAVGRVDRRCRAFGAAAVGVETNFGGSFLLPLFDALHRAANAGRSPNALLPPLPLKGVPRALAKEVHIRHLDAHLARRQVRILDSAGGRLTLDQLRDFPLGDHDDGPDAMSGAVQLAGELVRGRG